MMAGSTVLTSIPVFHELGSTQLSSIYYCLYEVFTDHFLKKLLRVAGRNASYLANMFIPP